MPGARSPRTCWPAASTRFSRTTSAGAESLFTDALGSTIAVATTTEVAAEYSYQPFGATTVCGTDLGNPTRFAGRTDDGNGLYVM